jgi:hypothetical protein
MSFSRLAMRSHASVNRAARGGFSGTQRHHQADMAAHALQAAEGSDRDRVLTISCTGSIGEMVSRGKGDQQSEIEMGDRSCRWSYLNVTKSNTASVLARLYTRRSRQPDE